GITGQCTIALCLFGSGDDATGAIQLASIGDLIDGNLTADKLFEGNLCVRAEAQQLGSTALIDLLLSLYAL
ncbi:hypothetical protein KZ300_27570, partial [Escherichia coli]